MTRHSTPRTRPYLKALLLSMLILPAVGYADLTDRFYLSAGFGWDYADPINLDSNGAEMNFDQGVFQPTLAAGMYLFDHWRVELERSVHENSPEILYSSSAALESDSDEADAIRATSLMLNVFRDFEIGIALRPYLGVGIGRSKVALRFSEPRIEADSINIPRRDIIHDNDTGLALQLIAGFTVPISRHFDIAADYRYWQASSVNLQELSGADFDTDHRVHSAWVHLRFHGADAAGGGRSPAPRAEPMRGLYIATGLGGQFVEDTEIVDTESVFDAFDIGPVINIALGYGLGERWRFELEGGYRHNAVEVFEISGAVGEDFASGELNMTTLMANSIFQFAPGSALRPYAGVGVGLIRADYEVNTKTFCKRFTCGTVEERALIVDDKDMTFAAQAILGVDIAVTQRLHFTADYRYLLTGKFQLEAPDGSDLELRTQRANMLTAGFRYALGSPD